MPTFKNRQEYEAWKASREAINLRRPPAVDEGSGGDWLIDDSRAVETGQKLILTGLGATCLAWLIFLSGGSFSSFLTFVGPFATLFGCGILIHRPKVPIYYFSIHETLWSLAGTGGGAFNLYIFGAFAHESPKRIYALGIVAIWGGGIIIIYIYSLLAKQLKGRQ